MHADFWHARWQQNQIGFHLDIAHPLLIQHWKTMGAKAGEPVFVPLCGKSLDLWWLRQQGQKVIGVELSPLAVRLFYEEAGVTPARISGDVMECWQASDIRLYCGDFFVMRPQDVTGCRLVYDRASLIALPPAMRREYVLHLCRLFPQGVRILLVTLDYLQTEMDGPPFAVTDAEVHSLYGQAQRLESRDVLAENDRFRQRGVSRLNENIYLIELKPCSN